MLLHDARATFVALTPVVASSQLSSSPGAPCSSFAPHRQPLPLSAWPRPTGQDQVTVTVPAIKSCLWAGKHVERFIHTIPDLSAFCPGECWNSTVASRVGGNPIDLEIPTD